MDPGWPKAQPVAINNGKILSVTTNDNLKEYKKRKTKVIDLNGKTILPGFIDAHIHMHAFAESFFNLKLEPYNDVRSISDIQKKIREVFKQFPEGTWIILPLEFSNHKVILFIVVGHLFEKTKGNGHFGKNR